LSVFYDGLETQGDIVKDGPWYSASHWRVGKFKIREYLRNLKSADKAANALTDATPAFPT
jgi:hypothetical protein